MELDLVTRQILIIFLLPLILLLASVFRQNSFSSIYLFLFFVGPIFSFRKFSTCKPNFFIKIVIASSISVFSAQVIFNIYLQFHPDLSEKLLKCDAIWKYFNLVGLYNLNSLSLINKFRLLFIDAIVFVLASIILYFTNNINKSICERSETNRLSENETRFNDSNDDQGELFNRIRFDLDLNTNNLVTQRKFKIWKFVQITHYFFEFFFLILLGGSAILNPSLLSIIYFLILIILLTWFGFNLEFGKVIKFIRYFICAYTFLHLFVLFVYQIGIVNEHIAEDNFYIRIFGLIQYVKFTCSSPSKIEIIVLNWNIYAHPFFLVFLYLTSSYMIKFHFEYSKQKIISNKNNYRTMRDTSSNRSNNDDTVGDANDDNRKMLSTNETSRKTISLATNRKIRTSTTPSSPSVFNNLQFVDFYRLSKLNLFINSLNLIKKGSYVATLIMMMTWSITYHSWMGFILLIWSCIIWMMPNSRQACLQSSIFLIIYAIWLLVIQYIFSLRINNLPSEIHNITLSELGFTKEPYDLAYKTLFIKLLYTLSFWITLRHHMEEKILEVKRNKEHENISANEEFHTNLTSNLMSTEINPVLNSTINVINKFLSKYWIIIVTLLLMVMSLSGKKVVLYRIIYMSLFLAFVLVFQISYRLWRRLIYLFWLIVIVYSMAVLVAIYTYQFKNFPSYWTKYLGITDNWQKAIGLEEFKHDPLLLFYQLFTPTFFIIITIIQVHFFHIKFLQFSDIEFKNTDTSTSSKHTQVLSGSSLLNNDESKKSFNSSILSETFVSDVKIDIDVENEYRIDNENQNLNGHKNDHDKEAKYIENEDENQKLNDLNDYKNQHKTSTARGISQKDKKSKKQYLVEEIISESPLFGFTLEFVYDNILFFINSLYELIWRALELHMTKIIFICSIVAAIDEINLANFVFIILIMIGLPFKKFESIIFYILGSWASFLILTKMFYQLEVAQNINWKVNCSVVHGSPANETYKPFNETLDNLNYIGFIQTKNLFGYIFKDLLIVLVLALNTFVIIRQNIIRLQLDQPFALDDNLFFGIYRKHADTNFLNFLKFFANYWFYKFGIEFIAVFLVFAIAERKDIIAFYYSLILICITLFSHKKIKMFWLLMLGIQSILLPIEYLLLLGLAPGLCTDYPWSGYYLDPIIRKWLFLSDFQIPLDSNLLIYDFFLLLFITRQRIVFSCENQINRELEEGRGREEDQNNGGINDDLKDENYITIDPNIKDYFLTSGKTLLDILKSFFFSCFYWITLAILFITANNRQNLFGLGYIVGCFVFLWNGNDFYLKTRRKVFKNWNYLIFYTSFVIIIKTILALVGCYFAEELFKDYCALAKLFGIDCDSKLVCMQTQPYIVIENKNLESLSQDCLKASNYGNSLFWDAVCLLFLLIQKRIFGSYYFNYLVIEIKAQQRLASRGAELINEIQAKEYKEEKEEENELMEKIKAKMDLIRANQRKTLGSKIYKPKHHYQACRSGDYYMVDNPDAEVIDSEEKEKKSFIPDPIGDELKKFAETRGFSAFCSNFVKGNFFEDEVLLVSTETTNNIGESSKDSAIVSIDRSEHKSQCSSQPTRLTNLTEDYDIQPMPSYSAALTNAELENLKKLNQTTEQTISDCSSIYREQELKHKESFTYKIQKWCKIIKYFIISCLISATVKLNEVSRDYRYVSRRLAVEKKALKCIIHLKATPEAQKQLAERISNARVPEVKIKNKKLKKTEFSSDYEEELHKKSKLVSVEGGALSELADYYLDYNVLMRFIFAIYYAIISQSETLCYVCVIVNQMKNASLISLPLPFMVFLWGCLSLPRPNKTFWISLITYTEAIVVAKYMFQFKVWEWTNFNSISPNWPNIYKNRDDLTSNNSSYDLFLLLVLFFHRFMLKSLGLWDMDISINQFEKMEISTVNKHSSSEQTINKNINSKNNQLLENQELRERKKNSSSQSLPHLNKCNQSSTRSLDKKHLSQSNEYKVEKSLNGSEEIYFTFFLPFHNFFKKLFKLSKYRIPKDSYATMFLCDFINFFIVVFGYSSFGSTNTDSSDITTYFREDRVPILFLVMLLIQFLFIIIDRALYLRKNIFGRLIFHILIVLIIHLWLFFVLPLYTQRSFTTNLAPQFWYVFKTIYLILSANQIKSGYPTRILGNCFTKKYTLLNLYLFKTYMAIPFLYDLRLIMDWIWTESSLDLNEWAIMEDIFKQLFERKCEINYNDKFPYPRGEGRRRRSKFIMGGFYFMIVVIAIWFPLTLFAFGSQVGTPTKPVEVAINLEFISYQPIFKMSSNQNSLEELNQSKWNSLQNKFPPTSSQFLSYYNKEDVVISRINGNSFATWNISPPNKQALQDALSKNSTVVMKLTWKIRRKKKSQNMDVEIFNEREIALSPNQTYFELRAKLVKMLENKNNNESVTIPLLFPNCIRIPSKEEPKVINELQFQSSINKSLKSDFRDIKIKLNQNETSYWWTVSEIDDPYAFMDVKSEDDVILLLFNDRVFPDSLQFLSGYGIVGLYSTFVFVVSRFIRNFFDDLSFKVIYTQLPCVRKVLQLCLDIYLVRESGEFELEEDLYAKLIFLYRSPETLINWTQNRESLEKNNSSDNED